MRLPSRKRADAGRNIHQGILDAPPSAQDLMAAARLAPNDKEASILELHASATCFLASIMRQVRNMLTKLRKEKKKQERSAV